MGQSLHGKPERYPGGLHEAGPGCHAWIQPNGEWFEANAGLVVGEGESLVVDTLSDLTQARRLIEATAGLTADAPVRTIVNTHSDADHIDGNQLFPTAEIVTSRRSAAIMRHQDPAREFGRFRKLAGAMKLIGLLPIPRLHLRPIGTYLTDMLAPFDFSDVEIRQATSEFEGEKVLDVGGRRIRLFEVGPAHTPGDLMVHVPDAGVVYTGDILFIGGTPVIWAGPVANWIGAIDGLLSLDAETFVPGHGPVCGRAEAEAVRRYWVWLDEEARQRFGRGMSAWEAAQDIVRDPAWPSREWAGWSAPERIVINLMTLEKERNGELGQPPSPRELVQIFSRVALLARQV